MKMNAIKAVAGSAIALVLSSCSLSFPERANSVVSQPINRVEVAASMTTADEPATMQVIMFADELHTGLILDLEWLQKHGYVIPDNVTPRKWAAFSWGDETAYVQERWLSPGQVVHALFMPSKSVMEIITFDYNIPDVCPHQRLYQAFVPESSGRELAAFMNRCAVRDESGRPNTIAPSSWGDGRLIESTHTYYFPRICNVWTVEGMRALGFEMNRVTGLSADGVIRQAEREGFRQIWDPTWQMVDESGQMPTNR